MLVDHHLLEKYWAGLCTPEEREAVERWMLDGIPEESYELRPPDVEPVIKNQLWERITEASREEINPDKTIRMSMWFKMTAIAAILFLLIGVGIYISPDSILDKSRPSALGAYQEVSLPYGKKASVTLPDGTKVFLNAGSKLKYPPKFSKTERRVLLDGEAFFEVTKDPKKPFFIQTRQTTTRVLGTRFNLQSWEGCSDILNVEEGRVQFSAAGSIDTLILHANTQGVFDGHSLTKTIVNSRNRIAWTKGQMIFNDVKLGEVIIELERWYGVEIHLSNPQLANNRVKVQFDNASLAEVLRDISFALNIKYKIKDKEVMLSR
ncbi:FecR family protein [Pedobacter antarcticus]|uniref:FecR family protein n=1 Tax=Pedobacter antarcticus TaxID=34086 RepID=UPI00292CED13|nr:FecR domain-containing protein [Pedobacter antarcticus]